MFKSNILCGLAALLCLTISSHLISQTNNAESANIDSRISFSFSLTNKAKTSAGVFKQDGTLIKTLWSGVDYNSGTYTEYWDGKLDNDTLALDGTYEIKVTSNSLRSEWGIIGNTSTAATGSSVNHSPSPISSMAFAGGYCYYAVNYNEGNPAHYKHSINNPQSKMEVLPGPGQATSFEATDGVRVYHAGMGISPQQFIFATYVSNDNQVMFSSGVSTPSHWGQTYASGIDITSSTLSDGNPDANPTIPLLTIGGMAVQKNGKYLFVSYFDVSQIHVLDKVTGALLQVVKTFSKPKSLAVDRYDNLWVCSGSNAVSRHIVNSDGTLSAAALTLLGLINPLGIDVSPDNKTVIVADGGASQEVKGYSNSTGSALWTLGQTGGYINNPTVANDKFMFRNTKEFYSEERTFVAYAPDGSFWVGDQGNCRTQHFAANRTFVETIMNLGYFYSAGADRNNSSRVFANYLEFEVDWTKPLSPNNGSWKLVKNWAYPITLEFDNQYDRLRSVTTLGNGRTYALLHHKYSSNYHRWHIVELPPTGNLRFTGIEPSFTGNQFDLSYGFNDDGSLFRISSTDKGVSPNWTKRSITGFDGSNNPVWGSDEIIASAPPITSVDPINENGLTANQITSSGMVVAHSPEPTNGYHLGGIKLGDNKWLWQSSQSTLKDYRGEFPDNGDYDIGNTVNNGGNFAMVVDSIIAWGYHGEFWKQSQTNKWNLFLDNGLFLYQFGITGIEAVNIGEAAPGIAGNVYGGTFFKLPNGDLMLVHNDENSHGALGVWRITGLNTILQHKISVTKSGTPILPSLPYINLMDELPFNASVRGNIGRWSFSSTTQNFNVNTNKTTYKKTDRDIRVFSAAAGDYVVCNIGTFEHLDSWKISARIGYPESYEPGDNFIDILDKDGKVIVRLSRPITTYPAMAIKANNSVIVEGIKLDSVISKLQPLDITCFNGMITVNYAGYPPVTVPVLDSTANASAPKTFKVIAQGTPAAHQNDIANLRFYERLDNKYVYFRSKSSGFWNDVNNWEIAVDSASWTKALTVPNIDAMGISIQSGHTISISDSTIVDKLIIQNGGSLLVNPNALLVVNDGPGTDIVINSSGSLIIQSTPSGTGRIGSSSGNISGNVTVEQYISSQDNRSYRLLSPIVNTSQSVKPFIRDNWQEGQNNSSVGSNYNSIPQYGTHITGSSVGTNGFDATADGTSSMYIYNHSAQQWTPVSNTAATTLDAKSGYLIYIRGDRSLDLSDATATSNTTLRATGNLMMGTQIYTGLENSGRLSLITNPYASPIDWSTSYNDVSTSNSVNFENYYTYWDPYIGTNGGYVSVNARGDKSVNSDITSSIEPGRAFFIRTKANVNSPSFTIKEEHKSSKSSVGNFTADPKAGFNATLYFTRPDGKRVVADGVNLVFNDSYTAAVSSEDAEEIANKEENIAIARSGKLLCIEGRPVIQITDTLPLFCQRLGIKNYQWEFNPKGFNQQNLLAYLDDNFLHTHTSLSLTATTTLPFSVNADPTSSASDRFRIVFSPAQTLPIAVGIIRAYQKSTGIEVEWIVQQQRKGVKYVAEKSANGNSFKKVVELQVQSSDTLSNKYTWYDANPNQGNNFYRVKMIDKSGSVEYSNTVSMKIKAGKENVQIFPNPVVGKYLTIQFTDVPKGIYQIQLLNINGNPVSTKSISHPGGSASQTIDIGKGFQNESFSVQITGDDGFNFIKQLLR